MPSPSRELQASGEGEPSTAVLWTDCGLELLQVYHEIWLELAVAGMVSIASYPQMGTIRVGRVFAKLLGIGSALKLKLMPTVGDWMIGSECLEFLAIHVSKLQPKIRHQ